MVDVWTDSLNAMSVIEAFFGFVGKNVVAFDQFVGVPLIPLEFQIHGKLQCEQAACLI
jgi:hypothetical protein